MDYLEDIFYPFFNHPVQRRLPTYVLVGIAVALFWFMTNNAYHWKIPAVYGDLHRTFPNGKVDESNAFLTRFLFTAWSGIVVQFFRCQFGLYIGFICSIISFGCIGEFPNNPFTIIQRYASVILILVCSWDCIIDRVSLTLSLGNLIIKMILSYAIAAYGLLDLGTNVYNLLRRYGFLN